MRQANKLKDIQCKSAKPKDKPYKLTDGEGLYLYVTPTGSKLWRMKYRHQSKESVISFGSYPQIPLNIARLEKQKARELLRNGINPTSARKEEQQSVDSNFAFEALAREWHNTEKNRWSENHSTRVITSLEQDVFPSLGQLHPNDIKPSDVLVTIRKIEARGAFETASKILQRVNAVFGYGIVTGWTDNNPASNLNKALEKYTPSEFSYIPLKDMPSFMAKLDNYGAVNH